MEGSLVAYKVFTNGSVLNASEINDNLMNQSVMVFSNSTARSAALTAPVEGMLTWLEDVNRYEYRNGSGAWVALASTEPGLVLVKQETIGSAVASVTVSDAFSADYENYLITINGGSGSTSNTLKMILGGTTTGYHSVNTLYIYNNGSNFIQANNNGAAFPTVGAMSSGGLQMELTLQNPFLSRLTVLHSTTIETVSTGAVYFTAGVLNNTTSYTAFTVSPNAGTLTGGVIRVYGYRKA